MIRASSPSFRIRPLPRPGRPTFERRRCRSNSAAEALELALTGAAQRGKLDVVLLADDTGMLVANSRTDLDLSMLAAVTPIVGRGRATPRVHRDGERRDMSVHPLELAGELFYVAAIGGDHKTRQRELRGSAAATQRILA